MSITCLSSKATGLLAAWRNPCGREEEQLERFFLPLQESFVKRLIKTGVAQAGFSLLALAASVETVAYASLTALSFPLYLGSNKPHFCLELLKSSSFTILWAIFEIFRGCYMIVKNDPLINAPTREPFVRMELKPLAPCLFRRQDRVEIIKQMLPHSSKKFIDFCIRDDIWTCLRHNILSVNNVLSKLCQGLEDPDSLDTLKELHITNLCKISSAERELYFLTIELIKEIYPDLVQIHLQNVQKICTFHQEKSLKNYFELIKSMYRLVSHMSLADRDSHCIKKNLQEINTFPSDLDQYLINLKNEIPVSIQFNQIQEVALKAIMDLANLDRGLNLWVS